MSEEYGESCPECGFNQKDEDERDQKVIDEFLESYDYMMERIEFHTENPDSELMDEVSEEYKKWEKRKTQ
jgi:hypothetical protein